MFEIKAKTKQKQENIRRITEQKNIEKFLEFKNYSLKDRLDFLLNNLKKAIEDNKIKNLIKAMNMNDFDENYIKGEIENKSDNYNTDNIENIENIVKYTLLCLLDHNDNNRYQLLHNKNKSYVSKLNFNTNVDGIKEQELKKQGVQNMKLISLAEAYYTFFKNGVNDLLIFYIYYNELSVSKPIIPKIRSYICDIYNGIVLLTLSNKEYVLKVYDEKPFTSRVLNAKPFTSRVLNAKPFTSRELTNIKDIKNFFKKDKNYLIIKNYDSDFNNCIYDCMIQIIYKIVSVLILYIKNYKQYITTSSNI